ncbi:hypothetical protein C2869_17545 [Saccharobesus litoralis]|uniref:Uncharacterized protein n=2 Tax=Saccharobesus litoralis TaxID=2172099 RepID=A0A2S0VV61_9ALTE|nr:hypothetical protein C2869_17545 [Saccharobesus litoralis]
MASAISKKIADFKQQYIRLVTDATQFFENYVEEHQRLESLVTSIRQYQEQVDLLNNYKKEKGKLPVIRGQKSSERYLEKLLRLRDSAKSDRQQLLKKMSDDKAKRYEQLDSLTDNILDLLDGRKIFSQFLGTIALSSPLPDEVVRCVRNEKYKPIYITALIVALFEEVRRNHQFKHPYLRENLEDIFTERSMCFMADEPNQLDPQGRMKYREEVLKPIAKVALVHAIGSYSPEVEAIFNGDRYRVLSQDERDQMLKTMRKKSLDYLRLGIGLPNKKLDTREERNAFVEYETRKMDFMLAMMDAERSHSQELRNLLRIPMTYGSFILSTKAEHDYRQVYQAYDFIQQAIEERTFSRLFGKLFLDMVGRFPVGSGVYFYCTETKALEKGIVSSLYPSNPELPIVKQVTRNQQQSFSQTEVIISPQYNFYFEASRVKSGLDMRILNRRYKNEYTWNPNELWETQIPAIVFWRKDGSVKIN